MLATIVLNAPPASLLGLSVPDAIAIGVILASIVAARYGGKQGDNAKQDAIRTAAGVSIAGALVDANQFGDWIKAQDKLAIAITGHTEVLTRLAATQGVRHTNRLEELTEELGIKLDQLDARMSSRRSRTR